MRSKEKRQKPGASAVSFANLKELRPRGVENHDSASPPAGLRGLRERRERGLRRMLARSLASLKL